jgi:ATP-dependent DNA helicase RecG
VNDFLNADIKFLKGVGAVRAEILNKELGIFTFNDLLAHYPFRYIDKSQFHTVKSITQHVSNEPIQLRGKIVHSEELGFGNNTRLVATFYDGTGQLELVWFKGVKWIKNSLKLQEEVVIYGKVTAFNGKLNITHPEMEYMANRKEPVFYEPVYSITETMRKRKVESKALRHIIHNLLHHEKFSIPEIMPKEVLQHFNLISRQEALQKIHQPKNNLEISLAHRRLKFDELFSLQFPFLKQKLNREAQHNGIPFKKQMPVFENFLKNHLPFELTGAQQRVLQEIKTDVVSGNQMNRLLQGDVGSGKTIVSFLAVLMAVDNGLQSCIMAPTEILATQHYFGLKELADEIGLTIGLLTGSTSQSERKELHRLLRLGEMKLLVGTHALIEDAVQFAHLGLVVIDEQHRFGVAQRAKLRDKGKLEPHVLVMTATPIPRTLAMSLYGDLDYSVIDELPAGRKPIKTVHRFSFARPKVWEFLKNEIDAGRQAYIVYPLIEESEKLNYQDLYNGYDELLQYFPRPQYQVDMLHGKMKPDDKEAVMQRFKKGICKIIVSTTVIEVGINVPNASIMIIESSEKFGLSQLHQLRGRVGRGSQQSYCILMSSKKLSENAKTRLQAMVRTTSGFELSEVDMQLRGFGDIAGTRQSGLDQLKLASLNNDGMLAKEARQAAVGILKKDPNLERLQNLRSYLTQQNGFKEWSKIA